MEELKKQITIRQSDNGFFLEWKEYSENDAEYLLNYSRVVEAKEGSEDTAMADMLYQVAEFFGNVYQKYSDKNLNITFDKDCASFN